MFGISGLEAILIILIAFFVIGPERIPAYAEQLRELVRTGKRYADGAKTDLQDALGPEFADVDWKKLDPRQYDPRTIVRQALLEDEPAPARSPHSLPAENRRTVTPTPFDDEAT